MRARAAQATRADLLTAAMRRFTLLGYERTTMRDVAADVGVNVSLINRYFGSKDGLFAAVVHESTGTLEQLRTAAPDGLVETLLSRLRPDQWPEFGGQHPLLLLLGDVGGDTRVRQLRERSLGLVVGWLAGQAGPDTSADPGGATLNAELVLALVAGVLTLRATMPDGALGRSDPDTLRSALERTVATILSSSAPGPARPPA